jgi:hypothetical protein
MGKPTRAYSLAIGLFAAGLVVGGLGAILGFQSDNQPLPQFGLELAKAALTLGTGLILGGAVKVMLDRYQEALKERQEDHELRERLLADLRDVHDRTESARLMVNAHRSAKAYGEQMRDLICQVTLLKIKRTLDLRPGSTRDVDPDAVCLGDMIGYLRAMQDEYASNYSLLADCARYDETVTRQRLNELAQADKPFKPGAIAASHHAWSLMSDPTKFPVLDDLSTCGELYTARFRQPLNTLAAQLLKTESPPLDTQLDGRVNGVAHEIEAICAAARRPVQTLADGEAASPDVQAGN